MSLSLNNLNLNSKITIQVLEALVTKVAIHSISNQAVQSESTTYEVIHNVQSPTEFTVCITDSYELAKEVIVVLNTIDSDASVAIVKRVTSWPITYNYV